MNIDYPTLKKLDKALNWCEVIAAQIKSNKKDDDLIRDIDIANMKAIEILDEIVPRPMPSTVDNEEIWDQYEGAFWDDHIRPELKEIYGHDRAYTHNQYTFGIIKTLQARHKNILKMDQRIETALREEMDTTEEFRKGLEYAQKHLHIFFADLFEEDDTNDINDTAD